MRAVRTAVEQHPPAEERERTGEGAAQVQVPGSGQAHQAEDLTGVQLQADGSGAAGGHAVQAQDGRAAGGRGRERGRGGRGGPTSGRFASHDVAHQPGGAVRGEGPLADEAPVAQYGERVRDPVHLVEPVADVEDAVPPVAQGVQDVEEPGAVRGGEGGGRLVEDEELRPFRQGAGDGDQGALGGGEVGDPRVGVQVPGDGPERLGAVLPGPPPGHQAAAARVAGPQGDVLGDRHPLHQSEVLVDEGHRPGGGVGAERVPGHRHLARVGVVDPGEHLDEGGLSGAVGAEEGQDAAAADVEADRVQGDGAAEPLGQTAYPDERLRAEAPGRTRRGVGSVMHGRLRGGQKCNI